MPCVPCVLISSGRKGTFLIQTSLRGHPHVHAYEQLLVQPDYYPEDTGRAVFARLFEHVTSGARAVILPIAWNSARNRYPGFWELLRERRVHVVFLKRRNMLRWYLSYRVAYASGIWSTDRKPSAPSIRIRIDPGDCIQSILQDQQAEKEAAAFFANHPRLEIVYEDLLRYFDAQMNRLQRFLQVSPIALKPKSVKQETRPLCEAIENFDELRMMWRGTEWEHFLEAGAEAGVKAE